MKKRDASNEFGERLDDNHYATSILQYNVGEQCAICKQKHIELVRHEVFGGPNRWLSKRYGLWVTVCPTCHAYLHADPKSPQAIDLKQQAQHQAMFKNGWTTAEFIMKFGKNYLEDIVC